VNEAILLTSAEAAKTMAVTVETLHKMPIPYVEVGNGLKRPRRRYRRETLERWAKTKEAA